MLTNLNSTGNPHHSGTQLTQAPSTDVKNNDVLRLTASTSVQNLNIAAVAGATVDPAMKGPRKRSFEGHGTGFVGTGARSNLQSVLQQCLSGDQMTSSTATVAATVVFI